MMCGAGGKGLDRPGWGGGQRADMPRFIFHFNNPGVRAKDVETRPGGSLAISLDMGIEDLCVCLFFLFFPRRLWGFFPFFSPPKGSGASLVAQTIKNPPTMQETLGLIPGSGRSPGEGNDDPFQYSCLENPHGQGSLAGYNPQGRKESNTNYQLTRSLS